MPFKKGSADTSAQGKDESEPFGSSLACEMKKSLLTQLLLDYHSVKAVEMAGPDSLGTQHLRMRGCHWPRVTQPVSPQSDPGVCVALLPIWNRFYRVSLVSVAILQLYRLGNL